MTLTDALLVVALVAFTLLPLMSVVNASLLAMDGAVKLERAVALATELMEEQMAVPYHDLTDLVGTHPAYPGYRYRVEVAAHGSAAGVKIVRTTVSWELRGAPRSYQLTTLRSDR